MKTLKNRVILAVQAAAVVGVFAGLGAAAGGAAVAAGMAVVGVLWFVL
jgi:hypothetical protein